MAGRPDEKRSNPRIPSDIRVRSEGMQELSAVNLSAGGAYCKSGRLIDLMTRLDVVFDLPGAGGGEPLNARAVVVRVEQGAASGIGPPYHLALWFPELSAHDRARLRRYLGEDDH